jgi:glycosyltransferase involved in cell wall biosynthesis
VFIHQTGACNARNIALDKTNEDWVMLFDDDNRFDVDVFQMIFSQLQKLDIKALNTAYLQKGEVEPYSQNIQWPTFGSGCSMIHRDVIDACKFDMALEHGYGEDADFGMQIRNAGFDVIYTPSISILHLKAPVGGFRKPTLFPWSKNQLQPKPSPQIMYQRRKNFTLQQLKGYKLTLFLKFYKNQSIKNPITYYSNFKKRWHLSTKWSNTL